MNPIAYQRAVVVAESMHLCDGDEIECNAF